MEKYTYKDSGVEWLGDIPEHWKVTKVKKEFKVQPSNVNKKAKEDEDEVLLCNYVDVYYNNYITNDIGFMATATASENEIKKFQLKIGDVIITKDSEDPLDIAVPTLVKETQDKLLCGYHLSTLRSIRNKIEGSFLFWSLNNEFIASQLFREATGVTRWAIASRHVKNSSFAYPPLQEQKAITEYLDKATTKLDRIIVIKQEQLVKMEASFDKKLDEVFHKLELNSENSIKKMKIVVNTTKGYAFKSTLFEDKGHPIIKASDIKGGKINEASTFMSIENAKKFSKVTLKENDIVISTVGSQARVENSAVGQLAYVSKSFEGALLNQNTVILRINYYFTLSTRFLYFQLKTSKYREHLDKYARGTANQASLMLVDILKYKICIAKIKEQNEIVDSLELFNEKAFKTISNIKSQIKTLQAYRKSLIHECVTGKKQISSAIKNQAYAKQ
jgi:type I restriction enzyme S subunit